MNPQIEKLAEQAGFEEKDGHISIQGVYMFNTTRMEKFAELIVKECGVALSPMLRDMVSRGQAYNLIKEHFGVEDIE